MNLLRRIAASLKDELELYRKIWKHPQTPPLPRLLLGLALAYLFLPFDLIPDFLPLIGHLDDLLLVPSLIYLASRLVPAELIAECRVELRVSSHTIDSPLQS